jgi:hypothetical protein
MGTNPITPPLFSHPEVKHNKAPAKIRFFNENAFWVTPPNCLGFEMTLARFSCSGKETIVDTITVWMAPAPIGGNALKYRCGSAL